ncbi:MAG: hypothetical protein KGH78_04755 [Candidatus Micrarchaeota archaeon]|nr:hypothetical protein [Candidatus Micrarchaeota archaeon]
MQAQKLGERPTLQNSILMQGRCSIQLTAGQDSVKFEVRDGYDPMHFILENKSYREPLFIEFFTNTIARVSGVSRGEERVIGLSNEEASSVIRAETPEESYINAIRVLWRNTQPEGNIGKMGGEVWQSQLEARLSRYNSELKSVQRIG